MPPVDFEATINHVPLTLFEVLATSLGEPVTVYLNSVTASIEVCPQPEPPCPPEPMPPLPPLPPMPPCPPVEPSPPQPCPPWPPCPWSQAAKGGGSCPPGQQHPMMCCMTTVLSGILTQVGADFLALAVPIGSPEPAEILIPYPAVGAIVRGTAVCPDVPYGPVKKGGRMSVG